MGRAIFRIERHERATVVPAFLTLVCLMAGHALLETARDTLFLQNLPVEHLPWVYLAIAVLALGVSLFEWGDPGPIGLLAWCLLSSAVTIGLWWLTATPKAWVLYAVYIWSGFFISMGMVQFWLMTSRLFVVHQAKRVYGFIGAGSVVGALIGYGLATVLAEVLPIRVLLIAAAVSFAAAGLTAWRIPRTRPESFPPRPRLAPLNALRKTFQEPYLSRLGGLVVAGSVVFTLVDFIFKSEVAAAIPSPDLGAFFGGFYTAVTTVSLIVQLAFTSLLLRTIGVGRTLWILPILLTLGAATVSLGLGLAAAIALKSADGGFKHTVHRTAMEVLYIPVSDAIRPTAKRLIDMVGQRAAQAVSALVILAVLALGGDVRVLALILVVLGVAWTLQVHQLRPHYLERFRTILRGDRDRPEIALPELDMNALETLMSALNSADDFEVMSALDLFMSSDRAHLIPALILHHPSKDVVLRALDIFAAGGRKDHLPITKRLIRHRDPEIRAAAVRASDDDTLVARALADPAPLVIGTALVQLLGKGKALGVDASAQIEELVTEGDISARMGLARAIAQHRTLRPGTEALLVRLGTQEAPAVMAEAAMAMRAFPRPAFVHPLIGMLTYRVPRAAARQALLAMGSSVVGELADALSDPNVDFGIRVHLPATLPAFDDPDVPGVLMDRLLEEPSGMIRFKILRALRRMRTGDPDLALDEAGLREATKRTLVACYTLLDWQYILREGQVEHASPGHELLSTLVQDKLTHSVDRLFRLLDLVHPTEDFGEIYRGLTSTVSENQASSLELVENLVDLRWRDAVVGLVAPDGASQTREERLASGVAFYTATTSDYEALLNLVIQTPSTTLQAVAAYHVGELGLLGLRPALEAIETEAYGALAEVIVNAIERLDRHGEAR